MKRIAIALLVVSAIALTGCVSVSQDDSYNNPTAEPEAGEVPVGNDGDVVRVVDEEAGVVCYKYDEKINGEYGHAGGISCVPLNETDLDR